MRTRQNAHGLLTVALFGAHTSPHTVDSLFRQRASAGQRRMTGRWTASLTNKCRPFRVVGVRAPASRAERRVTCLDVTDSTRKRTRFGGSLLIAPGLSAKLGSMARHSGLKRLHAREVLVRRLPFLCCGHVAVLREAVLAVTHPCGSRPPSPLGGRSPRTRKGVSSTPATADGSSRSAAPVRRARAATARSSPCWWSAEPIAARRRAEAGERPDSCHSR